jgi:phosphohistidine phosphatase
VKTLHLLRHAKSDWSTEVDDHDRPLNRRGRRARQVVARHVEGWDVDVVVCSTARRTRETAEPVAAALGCRVVPEPRLYAASPGLVLDVVHELPEGDGTALLVGHNPSMEEVTALLCGASPRYPTAALGTVRLDVERWVDAGPGRGTLVGFVTQQTLTAD